MSTDVAGWVGDGGIFSGTVSCSLTYRLLWSHLRHSMWAALIRRSLALYTSLTFTNTTEITTINLQSQSMHSPKSLQHISLISRVCNVEDDLYSTQQSSNPEAITAVHQKVELISKPRRHSQTYYRTHVRGMLRSTASPSKAARIHVMGTGRGAALYTHCTGVRSAWCSRQPIVALVMAYCQSS